MKVRQIILSLMVIPFLVACGGGSSSTSNRLVAK
jgi:hypothetical protein